MTDPLTIYSCRRGVADEIVYCDCGNRAVKRCSYGLKPGSARDAATIGTTCGEPLCQRCATPQFKGTDPGICQAHARKAAAIAAPWDPTQAPTRRS